MYNNITYNSQFLLRAELEAFDIYGSPEATIRFLLYIYDECAHSIKIVLFNSN